MGFSCDWRILVRQLASPFGHPTQVSTQVQLAATCDCRLYKWLSLMQNTEELRNWSICSIIISPTQGWTLQISLFPLDHCQFEISIYEADWVLNPSSWAVCYCPSIRAGYNCKVKVNFSQTLHAPKPIFFLKYVCNEMSVISKQNTSPFR